MSANAGGLNWEKKDGGSQLISKMERKEDEGLKTKDEI